MHPSNSEANLLDVLLRAADEAPEQVVVHVRGDGTERVVTFAELRSEALRVAGGLIHAGLAPGTPLPLLADRGEDFQPLFWGALAAGLIPVPLAPARQRVEPVYEHLGRPAVLIGGAAGEAGEALLGELPGRVRALRLGDLRAGRPPRRLPRPHAHDVAFLQFSSGSTGAPRGVELTHAGVLANLAQIRAAAALTDEDVLLGWMPYFHDMGLIGTHLVPMAARLKQVRLEPLSFAKRPALWLETTARHRATVLSAANFALRLAVQRIADSEIAALDLRHVRLLLVGAEPIGPRVWREFTAKTRPAGLDPRAPLPVYGLAEATLAVTFPPLGEVAAPLTLDRAALGRGRAEPTGAGPHAVELMDLGHPVPGSEVRITDGAGKPLGERRVGHVEVRGPQLGRGYHRDADATAAAFAGGWLRTGDLGFLNDGRLCVTGRHKDVVFVNGRTFHAPDLEEILAGTPGLPPGTAAVVGSTEPVTGAERVVGLVQWSRPTPAAAPVLRAAAARLREALGHDDVRVLPLPPGGFPRTTSGKLRRSLLRDRFEAGAYAAVEARVRAWAPASAAEVGGPATAGASASAEVNGRAIAGAPSPAEANGPAATGAPASATEADGPAATGGAAGAPRTRGEVEEAVLRVWARTLELPVDAIGPHDRFFALGGSSLKAMAVVAAVEETFGVCMEPRAVVDHDTVPALTAHLLGLLGTGHSAAGDAGAAVPASGPAGAADRRDDGPGGDAVAVLSTACRFPGAATPEAFWDLLVAGRRPDSSGPSPDAAAFDAAGFDAAFFGMDEEEARATDPQARLFLELAHEALERAGYAGPRRTGRRIGVFAAVGDSGYREVLDAAVDGGLAAHRGALTGNLPNLVAAPRLARTGPRRPGPRRRHGVLVGARRPPPGAAEPPVRRVRPRGRRRGQPAPVPHRFAAAGGRRGAVADPAVPALRCRRRRLRARRGRRRRRARPPRRRPALRRPRARPRTRHGGQQRRPVAEPARAEPEDAARGHRPRLQRVRRGPGGRVVRRSARHRHSGRRPGGGPFPRGGLSAAARRAAAPARLGEGQRGTPAQRGRDARPSQGRAGPRAPAAATRSAGRTAGPLPGAFRTRLHAGRPAPGVARARTSRRRGQRLRLRRYQRPRGPGGGPGPARPSPLRVPGVARSRLRGRPRWTAPPDAVGRYPFGAAYGGR